MDVQEYMQDRIPLVDAALDKLVPSAEEPPLALHAAMQIGRASCRERG